MTIKIEFEVDSRDATLFLALYEALNDGTGDYSPHLEENMGWLIEVMLAAIVSKIDRLLEQQELESIDEVGGMVPKIYKMFKERENIKPPALPTS